VQVRINCKATREFVGSICCSDIFRNLVATCQTEFITEDVFFGIEFSHFGERAGIFNALSVVVRDKHDRNGIFSPIPTCTMTTRWPLAVSRIDQHVMLIHDHDFALNKDDMYDERKLGIWVTRCATMITRPRGSCGTAWFCLDCDSFLCSMAGPEGDDNLANPHRLEVVDFVLWTTSY